MANYDHIEIQREDEVRKYKFRKNNHPPVPPTRDSFKHGVELKKDLLSAIEIIKKHRAESEIDSTRLMVLEINVDSMSPQYLEVMMSKFHIFLVEEVGIKDTNKSKLVIQFIDDKSLQIFNEERELWQNNSEENQVLTVKQRNTIFSCIDNIRSIDREDRIGPRLRRYIDEGKANTSEYFTLNIDIWFNDLEDYVPEIEVRIKKVLGTQGSKLLGDLMQIPGMLLGRVLVNSFSMNALLDCDIVAMLDLPFTTIETESHELYDYSFKPIVNKTNDIKPPLASVIDSGVFSANPLLKDIIVAEEEFDHTENTTNDLNGHGTGVAGIVAYGDMVNCLEKRIFTPYVHICSGKIMHDENGDACFPRDIRPESIVKEAIEFFYYKYHCRVFNLSVGDAEGVYTGGRQFAWAEVIDRLCKDLDIVVVISAGNVSNPNLTEFISRDDLIDSCRSQLFCPEHRLINPATSALGITVGSITRNNEPEVQERRPVRVSIGDRDSASVFTRIGKGVNKSIKPELVDYGGNYAVTQFMRGRSRWCKNDRNLMEPTLNNTNEKIFTGYCGTSFSAPHVTHIAARIERSLENQMGKEPSANLIKAMLINAAACDSSMKKWSSDAKDPLYHGMKNPVQDKMLRIFGFGKITSEILYSEKNRVTLFAEDSLDLRSYHLYKIPVPKLFLQVKSNKKIVISLAYNPDVKLSRKEYLTNNVWFEVYRRIDEDILASYKSKKQTGLDAEDELEKMPDTYKAKFTPGHTETAKGTLQQSIWSKGKNGGSDLLYDVEQPFIYILVTGKECFRYAEKEFPQNYALVITFSYDSQDDIQLYDTLRSNVHIKVRQKERIRNRSIGK